LDLHGYLAVHDESVWAIDTVVDVRHELTALQHKLDARALHPIILASKVRLLDGSQSALPLVTNLTASRRLAAAALGLDDHRRSAEWFASRTRQGIEPHVVDRHRAEVQEVVLRGDEVDLTRLPALVQHELEPGPYLTAAHATTVDPDSGIDNTAIQRCWLRSPREMTWFPYPASHNAANLRRFWDRGEPCPVAFWIGHHPAVVMGAQAKLSHPESHWSAAGGLAGESLALVSSLTLGESIRVPAHAEIVIEGLAHPGRRGADGPFGEYTGYLGPQVQAPLVEVTCITRRHDAVYHDIGSGLADNLVADNLAQEGALYALLKPLAPSLVNVHVPSSGRRFHAWLQFRDPPPGELRSALDEALRYRRVKTAIAVDEDIDLFDSEQVMWALATRVQWSRDARIVDGLWTSMLDPSLDAGAETGSKLAVDATLASVRSGRTPRATVPAISLQKAESLLASVRTHRWPADSAG